MNDAVIPFLDLKAQQAPLQDAIDLAVQRVMSSGQFILGPEGQQLEQELA